MIASDPRDGELERRHIAKHISAVLVQLAIFIIGELAIIVARVLPRGEHIHHLGRPDWHYRLEHYSIDEGKNGRVNANCQRKRQYGDCRESRRLEKLPQSKPEVLHHNNPSLFSLRCSLSWIWIQQCARNDNFLSTNAASHRTTTLCEPARP